MSGVASLFREIHRLRRFLHELQENLDRIPRTRKAHQTKLTKAEQTLRDEQEAIKKLKVLASDKEKQLRSKGEAIERYSRQQNEVTSKKELDALTIEITHARDLCGALENDILQAMSEFEERQARLPDVEKALAAVKADVAKFDADAGARKATLESEMVRAKAQLKEAEAKIPSGELRAQYDRTINSLGPDGFAVVNDKNCTECHTEINRSVELRLINDDFALCPRCGRILYLPEQKPANEE